MQNEDKYQSFALEGLLELSSQETCSQLMQLWDRRLFMLLTTFVLKTSNDGECVTSLSNLPAPAWLSL